MKTQITATQLFNFVQCPHRVFLDMHGVQSLRDEPSEFTEMLQQHGCEHEKDVVAGLPITADMSDVPIAQREEATREAMKRGEPLIYAGQISSTSGKGIPDLLKKHGNGYIPQDIKAGSAMDEESGKLKKDYAFQLAHYVRILEDTGFSDSSREASIIDGTKSEVPYLLNESQGIRTPATWFDAYEIAYADVAGFADESRQCKPAMTAACKLCQWKTCCKEQLVASSDLSLIAELGRSKRDAMESAFPNLQALADADISLYLLGKKKTVFSGIGEDSLIKYKERAVLLTTPDAVPYLKQAVSFPQVSKEIMFDIEDDPVNDFVYLHGFVERSTANPSATRFCPVFAEQDEETAFTQAWNYLASNIGTAAIYYYSPYEKTTYKDLAKKYPGVCSEQDVIDLFAHPHMIDLYSDVVRKHTEWPTYDQSIKTLAKYLGFYWRDINPSGAASIEWYRQYKLTGDVAIKHRICAYNEDDCLATAVVLDGIRKLKIK